MASWGWVVWVPVTEAPGVFGVRAAAPFFRAWLALVGVPVLILSAAGIAQASRLTNSGTAILDAGNGNFIISGCIISYGGGQPLVLLPAPVP
jgi:hypothetical protein